MVQWWLHELAEDHKGGFCGHEVRHMLQSMFNGYMGRLRTTRVRYPDWLGTTKMAFVLTLVGL